MIYKQVFFFFNVFSNLFINLPKTGAYAITQLEGTWTSSHAGPGTQSTTAGGATSGGTPAASA